ncbi:MAG: AAA family ATPase [Ruminococcaceae bacterium]|nr:AAA family ATPase [Oscillospiraceae bacterium]
MVYLKEFTLPTERDESGFILSYPYQLEMKCYSHENVYPFKLFPQKGMERLEFEPITVFYGGNGSGKSTLLNLMAKKLNVPSSAPVNETPYMDDYLSMCRYSLAVKKLPAGSLRIASDDVFDMLLDIRSVNGEIDRKREELFREYYDTRETPMEPLRDLSQYEDFKRRIEAKSKTKSVYVSRRLPREMDGRSNGETAFYYFTQKIEENALYLLDEPENSLSPKLQRELAEYLENAARFFGCQFVISTHSPFLLAMKGAMIYDLDSRPVQVKKWTELENVREYFSFFEGHREEFR